MTDNPETDARFDVMQSIAIQGLDARPSLLLLSLLSLQIKTLTHDERCGATNVASQVAGIVKTYSDYRGALTKEASEASAIVGGVDSLLSTILNIEDITVALRALGRNAEDIETVAMIIEGNTLAYEE